jgi:hypothetical protein
VNGPRECAFDPSHAGGKRRRCREEPPENTRGCKRENDDAKRAVPHERGVPGLIGFDIADEPRQEQDDHENDGDPVKRLAHRAVLQRSIRTHC